MYTLIDRKKERPLLTSLRDGAQDKKPFSNER